MITWWNKSEPRFVGYLIVGYLYVVDCPTIMWLYYMKQYCFFMVMNSWTIVYDCWWWICRDDLLINQCLMYGCIVS